jgi:hypothetical protein
MSLAAMAASLSCMGMLFLYALVAPTRPPLSIAIVAAAPDAQWRGGPVEEPLVTLASDTQ